MAFKHFRKNACQKKRKSEISHAQRQDREGIRADKDSKLKEPNRSLLTETLANREEEEAQARAPLATKIGGKIATPTKGDEKSRRNPPPLA